MAFDIDSTEKQKERRRREDARQQIRMLNALATVSGLAIMIVCDFVLAYLGGDWLDAYFQTGDHSLRMACICLAIVTVFLTFFKLIYSVMDTKDDDTPAVKENRNKL
jgi:uncharacterized membrane protein